jgi:GNAT superfamily N-acetyltransferase
MIEELTWDTGLFGRKIGRLTEVPSEKILGNILEDAKEQKYRYLTCRLSANKIDDVRILEKKGFYLTDIGILLERDMDAIEETPIPVREALVNDIAMLKEMVKGVFTDSRFYHDPFFTNDEADRAFQAWIENAVKGFADKVLLIGNEGFITCKVSGTTGNIHLIGVSPLYRGRGIGTALVLHALRWFKEQGLKNVTVRTQAGNSNSIKFYTHLGFKIKAVDISMGKILALNS